MRRSVLVLNHFAAPLEAPGGTRHVELFSQLESWDWQVLAADRNYLSRERTSVAGNYRAVRTIPYSGNGPARVLNWISYMVSAAIVGLRGPRPSVVYASSPHLLAALAGWAIASVWKVPFALEVRDLWPQVLADMKVLSSRSVLFRLLHQLEHALYRRADAIVSLTPGVRDHLRGLGYASKTHLIPNGAEPDDFVAPEPRRELRQRFGMVGTTFVYTGAHGPANGLQLLLDAAAELRDDCPEALFLLVGDGPAKTDLIAAAQRRALKNVRFIDPIPKREIPALLGGADVGLHILADVPLFAYGVSPNKLFDYMAAGLPVITNSPGIVAKIVEEADAGVAVEPTAIAHAVRAVLSATLEQRERWGHSGREHVRAHYSRRVLATRLEQLLETLLDD